MKGERASTQAASRPPGVQQHQQRRRLRAAVVRDTEGFAALKEEWDELYRDCPSATPFSSWEWLYSWWEVYREDSYGLRLITLREEASGLLVGLLPLMARRGRLVFLGDSAKALYWYIMTPYKDVLVREGWEEPVARAGARALKEMGGWRVADLQELMPDSAAWRIFDYWEGPKTSVPINDYLLIRANSWEELLMSISAKARSSARRTLRRIQEDGVRCEPAGVHEAERAAQTLVGLHRELWRGRRIDPEQLTPRYEAFMRALARRMTERGIGRIYEFRRADGEVLVSRFLLYDKDFVGAYVISANQEASRRYQFITLGIWIAMSVASGRNNPYISLMHYTSWDKLRWASEVVSSQRAILARGRTSWVLYANRFSHTLHERYHALLSNAQVYVHSEGAPRLIKNATDRYWALVRYVHSESAPRSVKIATERYYALRGKYGYYALRNTLRYRYELARARREIRKSKSEAYTDRAVSEETNA